MFVTQTNYPHNSTSLIDLVVDFDPLGDNAGPWLKQVRALVAKYNYPATPFKFYVTGGAAQAFDAVERIYELFPTEIALTGDSSTHSPYAFVSSGALILCLWLYSWYCICDSWYHVPFIICSTSIINYNSSAYLPCLWPWYEFHTHSSINSITDATTTGIPMNRCTGI
jgi:hypothetical protein